MLRFHAQTAGSTLTAQQPEVNTVRVTLQALAAVLGGTQSLHTNSRDEALSLPTEEAAGLALQTQQVIACESGVAEVADPLAGSFAVESLTDSIEKGSPGVPGPHRVHGRHDAGHLSRVSSSARFRSPPTGTSVRSRAAKAPSWASTASFPKTARESGSIGSTPG